MWWFGKHKLHDFYMELQDVLIYAVLWFGKHKLLDPYVEYSLMNGSTIMGILLYKFIVL